MFRVLVVDKHGNIEHHRIRVPELGRIFNEMENQISFIEGRRDANVQLSIAIIAGYFVI